MNTVRAIQKLNKQELEQGIAPEGSWHTDYRDTAFIYVGGLPFDLSEGDIITIFSQFGEPVWIKLARDRETGKSRGFCWLKYEDQRSTDIAVDNMGGATVMGRVLRVDHTRYKPRDDEDMRDNTMGELDPDEDEWRRKRRRTESESESEDEEERPMLQEEIELAKLIKDLDDDDPMKAGMVQRKQEDVDTALKKWKKAQKKEKKHHSRRHRRDDSRYREGSRDRDRDGEPRRVKYWEDEEYSRSKRTLRRDHSQDDRDDSREYRRDKRWEDSEDEGRRARHKRSSREDTSDERRGTRDRNRDRGRRYSDEDRYSRPKHPSRRDDSEGGVRRHRDKDRD
ncbi:hypothetical protein CC78DRAFT_537122 [Lojkania enalia]|uniref:RRM domain-containing protein n=1 Tax=Lojkania enalia TaxID=147567 RepID=A0A9P4N255_9PLEO|nr:hypothetical protein CC78DRAFT_537122 [Didymosphaeria enalia]